MVNEDDTFPLFSWTLSQQSLKTNPYPAGQSGSVTTSSQFLPHFTFFLTPPTETRFLDVRDEFLVLSAQRLHAATLQELLLLLLPPLLEDLILGLELRADPPAAGRLRRGRPDLLEVGTLGVEASPTAAATTATATATAATTTTTTTTTTWKTIEMDRGLK